MGLLSWLSGSKPKDPNPCKACGSSAESGMNGATEVRRPDPPQDTTVLTFGLADGEMLAGYCPVSDKIEPCTWKIEPIKTDRGSDNPKFRIFF